MVAHFYRHRLPHIRIDGAVHFVTWRLRIGQQDLSEEERECVAATIRHFNGARYALQAYVVMNDHVHVLAQISPDRWLEDIVSSWKSFTTNRTQREFGRQGAVWQDEYFDRAVRDDAEYDQKRDYILGNAQKRWPDIDAYRWRWALGMDLSPAP
jgi:REP element-mobilizing transposase RayT